MTSAPASQIVWYQTDDGGTRVDVRMVDETVWLSLDQMAELFQRDKSTVSRHISNVFSEGELERGPVVADFATTASDGKTYQVTHYNLDVIISVGRRAGRLCHPLRPGSPPRPRNRQPRRRCRARHGSLRRVPETSRGGTVPGRAGLPRRGRGNRETG